MENLIEKSEILFLYESKFTIPNGDPFTGEQRYDDETKHILVSDVRIKRFVRDYFIEHTEKDKIIYVKNSEAIEKTGESGSAIRVNILVDEIEQNYPDLAKELTNKYPAWKDVKKASKTKDMRKEAYALLKLCFDVRLFGGISTKEGAAVNITGPVQFALLNPSLNKVDLRPHQNTSVFPSKDSKKQGAMSTSSVVPYALNQIHGWINPYSAISSGLTQTDISELFAAMWKSINNANTRSKSNQNSVLLIQIVYKDSDDKLYGTDKLISINSDKEEEQIREMDDYSLDFTKLAEKVSSDKIREIRYYTEIPTIERAITDLHIQKIQPMTLI